MAKTFVISRFSVGRRLAVCWGEFRTERLEDDPKSLERCLGHLGLERGDPALVAKLRDAVERFYRLEARSLARFGPPKVFRIWRVDSQTLQVEFQGGYAELVGRAASDAALARCLAEMLANTRLLGDLKRELAEFRRDETGAG